MSALLVPCVLLWIGHELKVAEDSRQWRQSADATAISLMQDAVRLAPEIQNASQALARPCEPRTFPSPGEKRDEWRRCEHEYVQRLEALDRLFLDAAWRFGAMKVSCETYVWRQALGDAYWGGYREQLRRALVDSTGGQPSMVACSEPHSAQCAAAQRRVHDVVDALKDPLMLAFCGLILDLRSSTYDAAPPVELALRRAQDRESPCAVRVKRALSEAPIAACRSELTIVAGHD